MIMFYTNYLPWFWLILMVLMLIVEALSFNLTTIWAAAACVPLIFASKSSLPLKWQLLIFVTLTLILVIFTRPIAVKKIKISKTNINSLIGQNVIVIKDIAPLEKGEVKNSSGIIWSAKSKDGSKISCGTICSITAVTGNTLEVEIKNDSDLSLKL